MDEKKNYRLREKLSG